MLSECYAESISVVICGLQGPVDCELVFIKGKEEIFKKLLACVHSHVTTLPCTSRPAAESHTRHVSKVGPGETLRDIWFKIF